MSETAPPIPLTPEFRASLLITLASEQWVKENAAKLVALYPTTWTHMGNLNGLKIGFDMKLLGIDWRSEKEFAKVMILLERMGVSERQNLMQIRGNPNFVFNPKNDIGKAG